MNLILYKQHMTVKYFFSKTVSKNGQIGSFHLTAAFVSEGLGEFFFNCVNWSILTKGRQT